MKNPRWFANWIRGIQEPRASLLIAVVLFTLIMPGYSQVRTWTDVQGRSIQATLIATEEGAVLLRRPDGQSFRVPMDRLCEKDRNSIHQEMSSGGGRENLADPVFASRSIDQLIEVNLAALGLKPNPRTTDEQFIRRLCLHVVGRIPKREEVTEFLGDTDKNKRSIWIDKLLSDHAHAGHLYNYFADMLRIKGKVGSVYLGGYMDWTYEALKKNMRYDEFVRTLLQAKGSLASHPEAGYFLRDAATPLDNVSVTSQIFLGTDISCAQCHDHPFEDWTQKQFYQMAAFFAQKRCRMDVSSSVIKGISEKLPNDGVLAQKIKNTCYWATWAVRESKDWHLHLPDDYKYADGKPGEEVRPVVLFGAQPPLSKEQDLRHAFCDWLVSAENPRFAITIANRLWKRAFGRGVVEPVHNVGDLSASAVPGLLPLLGEIMKAVRYDLQAFERVIYNTRAWQREAGVRPIETGKPSVFAGPDLQRMSAAQFWDSLLTLMLPNPDYYQRPHNPWSSKFLMEPEGLTVEEVMSRYDELCQLVGKDSAGGEGGVHGDANWLRTLGMDPQDFSKSTDVHFDEEFQVWRLGKIILVRSWCLPQPENSGANLLVDLGMSERNLIDASSTLGSVPVVLTLLNGPHVSAITASGSRLMSIIDLCKADGPKVEVVFASVLSRMPDSNERSLAYKSIRRDGRDGLANVAWCLLNTREFLFIQ